MKTAFTYWDERIAPVFDTARQLHIVEIDSDYNVTESQETLPDDQPVQRVLWLSEQGIDDVVCGAISKPMYELLTAYGIQVTAFIAGELRDVIQARLAGQFLYEQFPMPGCHGNGNRRRWGHGVGAGGKKGLGRMNGLAASGPFGYCLCPQCGRKEPHRRGEPCTEQHCSQCGNPMVKQ